MTRMRHKKSRAGCSECKRRHIKCDERHPICVNCDTSGRRCPFEENHVSKRTASPNVTTTSPPSTITKTRSLSSVQTPTAASPAASLFVNDAASVNTVHLELFYHFITETCASLVPDEEATITYRKSIVKCAMGNRYLMDELLSLSAYHISFSRPDQRSRYRHLSTSLQAKAIAGLDNILTKVDANNCLIVLYFSHLIGVRSFCDTFEQSSTKTSFSDFLTDFVHSINLLRGVEAVISPWRELLMTTDMGRVMTEAEARMVEKAQSPGDETKGLESLLELGDLTDSNREIYRKTRVSLQKDFDVASSLSEDSLATSHSVFSWLVTADSGYLTLLEEHRPEALILLAYYAVVLHRRQRSWVIGNAGEFLLASIRNHLGRRWEPWLAWPTFEIFGK